MKTRIFFVVLLFITLIISCNNNKTSNKITTVSLRQEWFPFSGYAGEVYAMKETAKKYNLNIKLDAGSDQIDPIKLVLSGENDFGVVSADRILQANEKGADLVVIGAVNFTSPTCFITKKDANIISPQDFINKKVGILTGTNTELIYRILKTKNGLENRNITEIEIPFDLATFISGEYDVRPAFIYDEPVSLDLKGIQYNIINPADFGIKFIGTVYFTTRKYYESNPEIVKSFVFAIAEGWKEALANPQNAVHYLKLYDQNIDSTRELLSLQKGLNYFKGEDNKLLYASDSTWNAMAKQLMEINAIKSFNVQRAISNDYVLQYNSK